jgi:myo-inositol-1(or 4)-monophosphatase
MKINEMSEICIGSLHKAKKVLDSLKDGGRAEINHERVEDISTEGDMAVSRNLIDFFKKSKIPAVLYSEEAGKIELAKNPEYTIAFDDIDGTGNYFRGRSILPHCTVVTIFDSVEPTFNDAVVAGVIEHNSDTIWNAIKGGGCFMNDQGVKTSGKEILDKKTKIAIDCYMGGNDISRLSDIFSDSWVSDFSTAALHLAGVGSGIFDAYISPKQKAHELGAGYLLIKEAGGYLTDWDGKCLGKTSYDFDSKYPVIAASTKELGKIILSKL